MAALGAVHGLGESVVRHLRAAYAQARNAEEPLPVAQRTLPACTFDQIGTGQLPANFAPGGTQVTLLMHRLGVDAHTRMLTSDRPAPTRPLSIELHYLVTAWSNVAAEEHAVLAWVMRELHRRPSLDRSVLGPSEAWDPDESVTLVPAEFDQEMLLRVWDALAPHYRLSVGYVARVIRLGDDRPGPDAGPVAAARFALSEVPAHA